MHKRIHETSYPARLRRLQAGLALTGWLALAGAPAHGADVSSCTLDPVSRAALEAGFFHQLETGTPAGAIDALAGSLPSCPDDPRLNLLLGLAHLWRAAEGPSQDPATADSARRAERHLERARRLSPDDGRIRGWLGGLRFLLASQGGDPGAEDEEWEHLEAAAEDGSAFHSFVLAALAFPAPRDGGRFHRGWRALKAIHECGPDGRTCGNHTRWPHNTHTFLALVGDYALKAGEGEGAEQWYRLAMTAPGYDGWLLRPALERRLQSLQAHSLAFRDADPGNDPAPLVSLRGEFACRSCHQ